MPFSQRQTTLKYVYLLHLYNVNLDTMILILDHDLCILMMNLHKKNEICTSTHSKLRAQARQRDKLFHVTLTR